MLAVASALLGAAPTALAGHCPPIDNPDPVPGQNTDYCHTPKPTPEPPPTPEPTVAPTTAPATQAPAPRPIIRRSNPAPTLVPLEIESSPEATIEVPGAVFEDVDDQALDTKNAASATAWVVAFILGLLLGFLIGRASWGLNRRKRSKQIFG